MSRWQYLVFFAALACSGCGGSDTLLILQRDANAFQSEIADSLIMVVDDSSAQAFLEQKVPRYKIRLTKLRDRITMWGKYADEDKKKVKTAVDAIRELVVKDKDALRESAFEKISEGAEYFRQMAENQANNRRLNDEARRIQLVVAKLAEKKAFAILEEWRAAGRKDSPRIRRFGEPALGQEVDPEQEWPFLFKMQNPTSELGGGGGKTMFE